MDASDWDQRYATTELIWTAQANQFLVEQVEGLAPGRALDLGAGEGRNAVWLAQRGWQVTAVDFSRRGVAKGRELAVAQGVEVTWVVDDVTAWSPPEQAFDLVIVFYLQLPAEQRRSAHRHAAAAVAPGGHLLVVGHDRDNLERGVGGPPNAAVLLTAADVTGDLAGSGLIVDDARQVQRDVTVDDRTLQAIDCLVRAHRPAAA